MVPKSRGNAHEATGCVHQQICCGHTEVFPICSQTSGTVYFSCAILPLTPLPFLRMSAHQSLRSEHSAYKLDGGNCLQNQI